LATSAVALPDTFEAEFEAFKRHFVVESEDDNGGDADLAVRSADELIAGSDREIFPDCPWGGGHPVVIFNAESLRIAADHL